MFYCFLGQMKKNQENKTLDQKNVGLNGLPHYMIHTCNKREWYVYNFLIPSLVNQGIQQNQIEIWHDYERVGNLGSFLQSLNWIKENVGEQGGFWHLQDDICISKNFKRVTEEYDDGIVCGFVNRKFNTVQLENYGRQPVSKMWFSFPCIRIPNNYAIEFLDWIYNQAVFNPKTYAWYQTGKMDDSLWCQFMEQKHFREYVMNLKPNIVNHIDYLLGGSQVNTDRGQVKREAFYWGQDEIVKELEEKIGGIAEVVNVVEHFDKVQEEFND